MHEKIRQTQNILNNIILQLCVLSCSLFIQKSSSIFHTEQSCDRLKSDTSAAQKKTNKQTDKNKNKQTDKNKNTTFKKKLHLGQVFQSVTSFET